jgi:hypothetical protein
MKQRKGLCRVTPVFLLLAAPGAGVSAIRLTISDITRLKRSTRVSRSGERGNPVNTLHKMMEHLRNLDDGDHPF